MAPPDLEFKYDGSFEQHVGTSDPALVKKTHKVPYLAISPSRPELSQSGKTILITGSSAGIGSFISRGFAQASASRVILTGRRQHILNDTAAKLSQEFGQTEFLPLPCDVGNLGESTALWTSLQEKGIFVDVLVLNAATFGGEYSILSGGIEKTWPLFETNVRSLLHFTERLHKQEGYEDKRKYVINVSTNAVHDLAAGATMPAYVLSKTSGHLLLQSIAKETDPKKLQIINFHPGIILSESDRSIGLDENSFPFDHDDLPAHFAVWAATPEAEFLHGRFAWASWDVEEMRSGDVNKSI
ncbi:hypothetical protein BKA56DRAFT_682264 [Ilyonectria sp. MPI-CAGE-AT-0026]|nr:hypothetical protein BKA56DRAFT_682264 [Ilyonectria sp. MPI-CAGE-AT-0026]